MRPRFARGTRYRVLPLCEFVVGSGLVRDRARHRRLVGQIAASRAAAVPL